MKDGNAVKPLSLPLFDRLRTNVPPGLVTAGPKGPLSDRFGRTIRYLRLSLTGACPMRCIYCRPAALSHRDRPEELTVDEIEHLVAHLVRRHQLRKVRLTGGEPTSRPDLLEIIHRLAAGGEIHDLSMTTNGLTLTRMAGAYRRAGLQRVNISLDSLDPDAFQRLTGVDALGHVLAGIDAAIAEGLAPVKLNTVVVRGENDHELPALVRFAAGRGVEIRFIELMPMGPLADRWAQRHVSDAQMRDGLRDAVADWLPLPMGSASARRFHVRLRDGRDTTIGFITAMSCPFCDACDRIRIGASGDLYPCLMDHPAGSVLPALRPVFDPDRLDAILGAGLVTKAAEHPARGVTVMTDIGG